MQVKNIVLSLIFVSFVTVVAYYKLDLGDSYKRENVSDVVSKISQIDYKDAKEFEIFARAGYTPNSIDVPANEPIILNIKTEYTYDCSASVEIKDVSFLETLDATGNRAIKLPPMQKGYIMYGGCSMGMYGFKINFI